MNRQKVSNQTTTSRKSNENQRKVLTFVDMSHLNLLSKQSNSSKNVRNQAGYKQKKQSDRLPESTSQAILEEDLSEENEEDKLNEAKENGD